MVELINITGPIIASPENITLILKPLVIFIIGMVIYSVFIFKFYRFVSKKDIFKLNLQQYNKTQHPGLTKFLGGLLYVLEYILLFPLFTFFWFVVFAVLLTFLVKQQAVQNLLLLSVAIIASIRMCAYYNESLAQDLAKLLPFALLGVFVMELNFFSFSKSLIMIKQLFTLWDLMIYYLIFVIILEIMLRIFHGFVGLFISKKE